MIYVSHNDQKYQGTLVSAYRDPQKITDFTLLTIFLCYYLLFFVCIDPKFQRIQESDYAEAVKTCKFGLLWSVFYAITHCLRVPPRYEHS